MIVCSGHMSQLWLGQWFSKCGEGNTGAAGFLRGHAFEVHIMILLHLDCGVILI